MRIAMRPAAVAVGAASPPGRPSVRQRFRQGGEPQRHQFKFPLRLRRTMDNVCVAASTVAPDAERSCSSAFPEAWYRACRRVYIGMVIGSGAALAHWVAAERRGESIRALAHQTLLREYPEYGRIFGQGEAAATPGHALLRIKHWTKALVSHWPAAPPRECWGQHARPVGAMVAAVLLALGGLAHWRWRATMGIWWRAILRRAVYVWCKLRLIIVACWRFLELRTRALVHVAANSRAPFWRHRCTEDSCAPRPAEDADPDTEAICEGQRGSQSDSVLGLAGRPGSVCVRFADDSQAAPGHRGLPSGKSPEPDTRRSYALLRGSRDVAQIGCRNLEMPSSKSEDVGSGKTITADAEPDAKASTAESRPAASASQITGEPVPRPYEEQAEQVDHDSRRSASPSLSIETSGPRPANQRTATLRHEDCCRSSNKHQKQRDPIDTSDEGAFQHKANSDSMEWDPPYARDFTNASSSSLDQLCASHSEVFGALASRLRSLLGDCTDSDHARLLNEAASLLQRHASACGDASGEHTKLVASAFARVPPIDVIENLVTTLEGMMLANAALRVEAAAVRREIAAGLVPSTGDDSASEDPSPCALAEHVHSAGESPAHEHPSPADTLLRSPVSADPEHSSRWRSPSESSSTLSDIENDMRCAERVTQKLEQQVALLTSANRSRIATQHRESPLNKSSDSSALPAILVTVNGSLHALPRVTGRYVRD